MYPCTFNMNIYKDNFKNVNIIFKEVPYLYFDFLKQYKQNITINKLHMFSLVEYDKVCFLDADTVLTENIDFLFKEKTPLVGYYINDRQEQCFSGGILLVKPSLSFYSLLLNLCITLEFYDDDNLLFYLYNENILKFNTFINDIMPNYRKSILQEQKDKKFFSDYNYEEIFQLMNTNGIELLKQYIDFY